MLNSRDRSTRQNQQLKFTKTRQRESDNEVDIPEENRSSNDAVDDSSKDSNGSESPCPVDEFGELSINTLNYKHTFL